MMLPLVHLSMPIAHNVAFLGLRAMVVIKCLQ